MYCGTISIDNDVAEQLNGYLKGLDVEGKSQKEREMITLDYGGELIKMPFFLVEKAKDLKNMIDDCGTDLPLPLPTQWDNHVVTFFKDFLYYLQPLYWGSKSSELDPKKREERRLEQFKFIEERLALITKDQSVNKTDVPESQQSFVDKKDLVQNRLFFRESVKIIEFLDFANCIGDADPLKDEYIEDIESDDFAENIKERPMDIKQEMNPKSIIAEYIGTILSKNLSDIKNLGVMRSEEREKYNFILGHDVDTYANTVQNGKVEKMEFDGKEYTNEEFLEYVKKKNAWAIPSDIDMQTAL
jgi:hypothetical protein